MANKNKLLLRLDSNLEVDLDNLGEAEEDINSLEITVGYDWDAAENVPNPNSPQQTGPIFFRTACKVSVFGISSPFAGVARFFFFDEDPVYWKRS